MVLNNYIIDFGFDIEKNVYIFYNYNCDKYGGCEGYGAYLENKYDVKSVLDLRYDRDCYLENKKQIFFYNIEKNNVYEYTINKNLDYLKISEEFDY